MDRLRAIGKMFGHTSEEATANAAAVGAGCALLIVAIPVLIVALCLVLWLGGLVLRLVF